MELGLTIDKDTEHVDSDRDSDFSFGSAGDDNASEPELPRRTLPAEPSAISFSRDADEAGDVAVGFSFHVATPAATSKRSSNVVPDKPRFEQPRTEQNSMVPVKQIENVQMTAAQARWVPEAVASPEQPMVDADNEDTPRGSSPPKLSTVIDDTAADHQQAETESDLPALPDRPQEPATHHATTQIEEGCGATDNLAGAIKTTKPATISTSVPASDHARSHSVSQRALQPRRAQIEPRTTPSAEITTAGVQHVRDERAVSANGEDYNPPPSSGGTTIKNTLEHVSEAMAVVRAKANRERDNALHKLSLAEQRYNELAAEFDVVHQQYANQDAHQSQEIAEHKAEVNKLKHSFRIIAKRNDDFAQQLHEMQEAAKRRNAAIRAHKKEAHGIHDAQRLLITKQAEICEHARALINVMLRELTESSHQTDHRQMMADYLEAELDTMAGLLHKARDDLSFAQSEVIGKEEINRLVESAIESVTNKSASTQPCGGPPQGKPDLESLQTKLEVILEEIRGLSGYQPDADTILDGVAGIVEDQISSDSANIGHQLQDILTRLAGEAVSRDRIAALEKEVQDATQHANALSEEKTSLATKSMLMEDNISLLKEKVIQLEKNEELTQANEDNALLQAELDLAIDRANQARAQVHTMEKERLEGWAEEEKKSERLTELEGREQDLMTRVGELKVQLRDQQVVHAESLAAISAEKDAELDDLANDCTAEAAGLQELISTLQTQAAEQQEHIDDLTAERDALRKNATADGAAAEHNHKLQAQNTDLHSKIADLTAERSERQAEVENLKHRVEDVFRLQAELDKMNEQHAKLLALYKAQQDSVAAREQEHAGELQSIRAASSTREKETTRLVREKIQIEEELEKTLEGNAVINERLAACQVKLATAEEELTQAKLDATGQIDSHEALLTEKVEELARAKAYASENIVHHKQELAAKEKELAQSRSDAEHVRTTEKNNYLQQIQTLTESRDAVLKEMETLSEQRSAAKTMLAEAQQSVMDKHVTIDQLKSENRQLQDEIAKLREHLDVALARIDNLEELRDAAEVAQEYPGQDTLNEADFETQGHLLSSQVQDEIDVAVNDAAALLSGPVFGQMSQSHSTMPTRGGLFGSGGVRSLAGHDDMAGHSLSPQKQLANTSLKLLNKPPSTRHVTPAPMTRSTPKTPDGRHMSAPGKPKDQKRAWKDPAELGPSSDFMDPELASNSLFKLTQKTSAHQQSQQQAAPRVARSKTTNVPKTIGMQTKTSNGHGSSSKKRKYEERFDMELTNKRR